MNFLSVLNSAKSYVTRGNEHILETEMRIVEDLNVVEKVNYKFKLARMTLSMPPQISVSWVWLI